MPAIDALELVPTRSTSLGTQYVILADVPQPWRDELWSWLPSRRARLLIDGVEPAALVHDWRDWLASRQATGG